VRSRNSLVLRITAQTEPARSRVNHVIQKPVPALPAIVNGSWRQNHGACRPRCAPRYEIALRLRVPVFGDSRVWMPLWLIGLGWCVSAVRISRDCPTDDPCQRSRGDERSGRNADMAATVPLNRGGHGGQWAHNGRHSGVLTAKRPRMCARTSPRPRGLQAIDSSARIEAEGLGHSGTTGRRFWAKARPDLEADE